MWRGMMRNAILRGRAPARVRSSSARSARGAVPQVRGGVAGRYVVTGGARAEDRGRDVRAVLACLRH